MKSIGRLVVLALFTLLGTFQNLWALNELNNTSENEKQNFEQYLKFLTSFGNSLQRPLHIAARDGDEGLIKFLCKYGADPDAQNNYGQRPLHIAAGHDQKNAVSLLIELGANIKAVDIDGDTPLHFAVQKNRKDRVAQLIELGANMEAQSTHGSCPIKLAKRDLAITLLGLGATPKYDIFDDGARVFLFTYYSLENFIYSNEPPLHKAVRLNLGIAELERILNPSKSTKAKKSKSLSRKIINSFSDSKKANAPAIFVDDLDIYGQTALDISLIKRDINISMFLLQMGANPRLGLYDKIQLSRCVPELYNRSADNNQLSEYEEICKLIYLDQFLAFWLIQEMPGDIKKYIFYILLKTHSKNKT